MSNVGAFLDNEVYPRLDRMQVFAALDPQEKGNRLLMRCPECGKREAFIYKDKFRLRCSRENRCAFNQTIIQFVAGTPNPPLGEDFINAARNLARMAGVQWEEKPRTRQELEFIAKAQETETRLEQVLDACALTEMGADYLRSRGFTQATFPAEFGSVTVDALRVLRQYPQLICKSPQDAAKVEATLGEWAGRIIGPIRDRKGRLRGVFARDITGESKRKYLYNADVPLDKIGLIGLDVALSNNNRDIAIWEACWDVFSLRANGFWKGAGVGGSLNKLSPELWDLLAGFGIRSVTLFTDGDDAGSSGLLAALENSDRAVNCPEIYVVDTAEYGNAKDPDEIVRIGGLAEFQRVYDTACHNYRYRAKKLSAAVDLTIDKQRDAYLESCIEFDSKFTDKRRIQKLKEFFWTEAQRASGGDLDELFELRDIYQAKTIKSRQHAALAQAIKDANTKLASGDETAARVALAGGVERAYIIESSPHTEPMRTVADEIDEHFDRWESHVGKEILGLRCGQNTLTDSLFGLRGFGILGARSNAGKTTEVCGLALSTLLLEPDACCLFYSLEMERSEIVDRLACYLARIDWRALHTDTGESAKEARYLARKELRRFGERLIVADCGNNPMLTAERMINQVSRLKSESECSRVLVIIDYIDVIEIDERKGTNERIIEKAQVKTVQMVSSAIGKENPIIGISEVRKGDPNLPVVIEDLSGTSRKGYAADWVIVMNQFSDKQLTEQFEYIEYVGKVSEPVIKRRDVEITEEKKLREEIKKAPKIRSMLARQGKSMGQFSLVKARDGGRRNDWFYTHYYNQSRIEEGIDLI